MTIVADSGPLIHLSIVQRFHLLQQCFHHISTIPDVLDEVITQGQGRPGAVELHRAIQDGWIRIMHVTDPTTIERLVAPNLSHIDSSVIACAIEHGARAVLSDDISVRRVAEREGLSAIGTVGILTHARLIGWVDSLKPLLDQLIREGFYLDPSGHIYQDALRRAGER
ncbi:MAG: DUF3368 domain-containing protein [Nitrospira sp.]|nr:DUF3368 domain-containing protein [Nitrospira sp.]MBH0185559.1 DUF3368 domain-containing protein [Nitrospira sp.]